MTATRRVYIDLGGVLAPKHIDWSDPLLVAPLPGACELVETVQSLAHVCILSSMRNATTFMGMARAKRAWVRRYISNTLQVIFVPYGSAKAVFMCAPRDILVDDSARNCRLWVREGGYALHHTDADLTSMSLCKYFG